MMAHNERKDADGDRRQRWSVHTHTHTHARARTHPHTCPNAIFPFSHSQTHKHISSRHHIVPRAVLLYFLRSKPNSGAAVKNLFQELDYDRSGDVDVHEFVDGLRRLGLQLTEDQLEGLHRDCDVNRNSAVTNKEFTDMLAKFVKEMNGITKEIQENPGVNAITHSGSRVRGNIPTEKAFLTPGSSRAWASHGDQAKISHSIRMMRMS